MSWTEDGQLRFNVFNKKKQATKYVEKGAYTRLGRLTSKTPENAKLQIDELYPLHAEALLTADLEPVEFPTMGEIRKKEKQTKEKLSSKL
eukprot:15352042-Ditylum_brightwellii.AAC.1